MFVLFFCILSLISFGKSASTNSSTVVGYFSSPSNDFKLWFHIPPNQTNVIQFEVWAQTSGWIGIGWSNTPKDHQNTDMIYGYVQTDGTIFVKNAYSNSETVPSTDVNQDLIIIGGQNVNGETTYIVQQQLVTNDPTNVPITNSTMYLQWAYCASADMGQKHIAGKYKIRNIWC